LVYTVVYTTVGRCAFATTNFSTKSSAASAVKTAKLFKNGRSQAVRLPKEFRFEGTEVAIRRDPATGDVMLFEPEVEPKTTLPELYAAFAQGGLPGSNLADRRALVARSSWQELIAAWDALGPSDDEEMERSTAPPVERDFF
jgi:antitoxin VapB